ncbi:MAG TPA: BrnT family toxin [Rhodothermales bacterium]|nr:BrnT family toxin [Rhodothermales bacterium]
MDTYDLLSKATGFQWDEGNADKNWTRHRVARAECEQAFFNRPLITIADEKHSEREQRFFLLGQSDAGRRLFIAFTFRGELIRVISARDMNRKERQLFATS